MRHESPDSSYFDHNASAPLCEPALEAMRGWLARYQPGNPSSVHSGGRAARDQVESARESIATAIGARPKDILLTSGATEANVTVLRGAAGPIVCSAIEHPSTLETARGLGARVVPVDGRGQIEQDALAETLEGAALCSIIWGNNEIGVLQDVAAISAMCRTAGVPLHLDAAQVFGRLPIAVSDLGCDYLTLSAHKVGGPVGIGALWVRPGQAVTPWLTGGHQERGRRAGTESALLATGFGAAAAAVPLRLAHMPRVARLRDELTAGLLSLGAIRNGDTENVLPNTVNLAFPGVDGEALLMALDMRGVAASSGSACTAGSMEPSEVLLALGLDDDRARSSVRFSLGPETGLNDVTRCVRAVGEAVAALRDEEYEEVGTDAAGLVTPAAQPGAGAVERRRMTTGMDGKR